MDIARAIEITRHQHRAVLATKRRDGRPQLTPVVTAVDDHGRLMISTRQRAIKALNALRAPQVSICILPDGFFGEWAQIDGDAEVVGLPDAMPLLEQTYRQVAGEHPDWNEFRDAMVNDHRVVLRITPTAAGPTVSG